jgi:hypothetical protein
MRKVPAAIGALALATVATLSTSSPALAATGDFGNACIATTGQLTTTYLNIANEPGNPLSAAAPSSGVITKAAVALPAGPFSYATKLKVARGTGVANQYTVQAESAAFTLTGGAQAFSVRVPVTAGDLIGLGGPTAFACGAVAGATAAAVAADAAVGAPVVYTPAANASVPVVATVEPDVDHDGYGDVTQDQCPQSALFQTACPVVKLASFAAASTKGISFLVTTNNHAVVKVSGLAKVKGKKVTLKGGTKTLDAGTLGQFNVRLPKALKAALAALPAGKTIKVTLTATATDLVGRTTSSTSTVKLHGTRH